MTHMLKVGVIGTDNNTIHKFENLYKHKNISLHFIEPWPDEKSLIDKEVIIVTMEWSPKWRITIDLCKKLNIPTYYLVDGVIDWDYLWNNWSYIKSTGTALLPLLSDRIGVVSTNQARLLSSLGLSDKIDIIGIPRLDNYDNARSSNVKNTILITTANTPFLNNYSEVFVKSALSDLKDYFELNKSYKVLWKIDEELSKLIDVKNSLENINVILEQVCATISFPSTVVLESMIKELPTAIIDYRNVPCLINTAWKISNKKDIGPIVKDLLAPNEEFNVYQSYCLSENISYGNATNRLVYNLFKLTKKEDLLSKLNLNINYKCEYLNIPNLNTHITSFKINSIHVVQYYLDAYRKEAYHLKNIINYIIYLLRPQKKSFFITKMIKYHKIIKEINKFIKRNL